MRNTVNVAPPALYMSVLKNVKYVFVGYVSMLKLNNLIILIGKINPTNGDGRRLVKRCVNRWSNISFFIVYSNLFYN